MKPIYSVSRFKATGCTQQNEPAVVTADLVSLITSYGVDGDFDVDKAEALPVGSSTIFPVLTERGLIADGFRITRLPDYRQGTIMFDMVVKEYVKVANGRCALDHSSTEDFARTHVGSDCVYAPCEAYALRPFIGEDGSITVAWTIRGVNPSDLRAVDKPESVEKQFAAVFQATKKQKQFIGRV